jgi:hypothetical protein
VAEASTAIRRRGRRLLRAGLEHGEILRGGTCSARPGVKVLMLGWELPPAHLGRTRTACAASCAASVAHGVEGCFVVPHMDGDERLPGASVVGADRRCRLHVACCER